MTVVTKFARGVLNGLIDLIACFLPLVFVGIGVEVFCWSSAQCTIELLPTPQSMNIYVIQVHNPRHISSLFGKRSQQNRKEAQNRMPERS
jgi:hypothetical protein